MIDPGRLNVAVLMGGPGAEREVSLASGTGVANALRQAGCAGVHEVDVAGPELALPSAVDVAFNVVHGTFGEDGQLQRLLDARGIPYTGEGADGSRAAFDKILTKSRLAEAGVASPEYAVRTLGERLDFGLPCVIKAPRQGSSVGVYIVNHESEVEAALAGVAELDEQILVERFVSGRELTVGVLGDQALPVIEIIPRDGFYDFRNKYPFLSPGGGARHVCPAALEPSQCASVGRLALDAMEALGLEVYGRVDVLLPVDGEPCVLEINTIPGMTEASLLPEAAAAAGIGYPELCLRIIELSLRRFNREGRR